MLKAEVFHGIETKNVKGYKGIQLLKRKLGTETEFITIMQFESLEVVKEFAGEDYEPAYVPDNARKILSHFDARSQHYEVVAAWKYH